MGDTKICAVCQTPKILDEFYMYKTRGLKIEKRRKRCKSCYKLTGEQHNKNRRKRESVKRTRKCVGFCGQIKLWTEFDNKCTLCKECRGKGYLSQWISDIKYRSKKRGWNFDVDTQFIREMFAAQNGKCSITKIPFTFNATKHKSYEKDPFSPSVDRINPNKGYTKDNVRLVCMIVNLALNEFGDKVFSQMCRSFVQNN